MKCPLCSKTMKYRFKVSENGFCGYWYEVLHNQASLGGEMKLVTM